MTGRDVTFLGLPEEASTFEGAEVLVLRIPYDGTASYGAGARRGPEAILDASRYVETYDEELGIVVEDVGFHLLPELAPGDATAGEMADRIYRTAREVLDRAGEKLLLSLGGEHSVTPGLVRAFSERRAGLSVLHLDAHADLREDYEGARYSHACAFRRIREHAGTTVSVGVRSLSEEEAVVVREERIPVFWARETAGRTDWIERAVDLLGDEVYVTVDLDVFDPSIMPATGAPEPGGLGWHEVLALLRRTAERRRIVGADLVELAPIPGMRAPDFLAARLATKIAAYAFEYRL